MCLPDAVTAETIQRPKENDIKLARSCAGHYRHKLHSIRFAAGVLVSRTMPQSFEWQSSRSLSSWFAVSWPLRELTLEPRGAARMFRISGDVIAAPHTKEKKKMRAALCFGFNLRSDSQAGRRGFGPRLLLHLFSIS